jgi:succinate-acetate transporter protein
MVRRLAVAAGSVFGIVGFLHYGLFFLFVPSILVLGAIVQPRSPRLGNGLLALGAAVLTFYCAFLGVPAVLLIGGLRSHHSLEDVAFLILSLVSIALVIWCDVLLVIEARAR